MAAADSNNDLRSPGRALSRHVGCCTPLRPSLCTYLILGVWDDFDTRFPSGRTKIKLFPTYFVVG